MIWISGMHYYLIFVWEILYYHNHIILYIQWTDQYVITFFPHFLPNLLGCIYCFSATHHQHSNRITCSYWLACYCFMDHKAQWCVTVETICRPGKWQSFRRKAWCAPHGSRITKITECTHIAINMVLDCNSCTLEKGQMEVKMGCRWL